MGNTHFAIARYKTDGSPDKTFGGGDGRVLSRFYPQSDQEIHALTIDSANRIVAGGYVRLVSEKSYDFALARYKTDGNPDETFGEKGQVVTHFPDSMSGIKAIAIDKDGGIIAGGWKASNQDGQDPEFALVRYDTHGNPDETFGENVRVTTEFPPDSTGVAIRSIAIDHDDRIVVGGYRSDDMLENEFILARYDSDGNLDTTFGNKGLAANCFPSAVRAKIYSIAIDNDDGIVAGGWAQFKEWWGAVLARYNSYGTLDTTFGDGDQAKSNSAQTLINSIAIDKQGRIVVGGYQEAQSPYTGSEKNALLARYTTKLTVDDSFGDHGQVNISFVPDSDSEITSIAIDEQERIVAGGWVRESHVGGVALRFALTRLTDDDFDPEFGEDNGKVLTKVTGDQTLHCLAIDHEGRIVAGGWATPARVVFPPLAVLLAGLAILATVGILATLGIFWAG